MRGRTAIDSGQDRQIRVRGLESVEPGCLQDMLGQVQDRAICAGPE